jgi:hypothetical protein
MVDRVLEAGEREKSKSHRENGLNTFKERRQFGKKLRELEK